MSQNSEAAMITILSSDNDDVQVIENADAVDENLRKDDGETLLAKRRVPLQRIATGKEIFSEFLAKCKIKDNSSEMERAVKKLWKRFDEASTAYTSSKAFIELVQKAIENVDSLPYSQLRTVADELRSNKNKVTESKLADKNSQPSTSCWNSEEANEGLSTKTMLHIKKLENLLHKIHKRIQRLENDEVDFNSSDEENSSYVQVSRYKERFCQVFKKLCEIEKSEPHAERCFKMRIKFSGTEIPAVDKAIEKFYNDQREFPDYRDILTVVQKANEVQNLKLSSLEIENIARNAFQKFGRTLKKYRQLDDFDVLESYITDENDPAVEDADLQKTLEDNRKIYGNRIDEIIDKYANKQIEERLEPSAVDSDGKDENGESEEEEEDPESDGPLFELKSDSEESANEDSIKISSCKIVLTDVRYLPEWEQYVLRKEKLQPKSTVIFENDSPWLKRKRSSGSVSENGASKKFKISEKSSIEPVPSTSKGMVPITLSNFRHINTDEPVQRNETIKKNANKINIEENSIECADDNDVTDVISDSCEKRKASEIQISKKNVESSPEYQSGNILSDNDAERNTTDNVTIPLANDIGNNNSKKTNTALKKNSSMINHDVCNTRNDEVKHSTISAPQKTSSNECSKNLDTSNCDSFVTGKHNSSKISTTDVVDVDDTDDVPSRTSSHEKMNNSKKENEPNSSHLPSDSYEYKSLPLEVVLNVGSSDVDGFPSKDNESDEVMIIEDTSKSNDVIDIDEISDSPEKPKKPALSVSQPFNLTQLIRDMKFKPANFSNKTPTASTSQITNRKSNLHSIKPNCNNVQNGGLAWRNVRNNPSNVMRYQNNAVNVNARRPLENNTYTSMNNQNMAKFYSNNKNVTMQCTQASQKRQCTERTIQVFDKKTNRWFTRKEVTTIVQQSVVQSTTVNRQTQAINRSKFPPRKTNSSEVITLD